MYFKKSFTNQLVNKSLPASYGTHDSSPRQAASQAGRLTLSKNAGRGCHGPTPADHTTTKSW